MFGPQQLRLKSSRLPLMGVKRLLPWRKLGVRATELCAGVVESLLAATRCSRTAVSAHSLCLGVFCPIESIGQLRAGR